MGWPTRPGGTGPNGGYRRTCWDHHSEFADGAGAMKFDFSQFHPLDHPFWRCVGYPGGIRHHLELAWKYKWSDELARPFALLMCRLGWHEYVQYWSKGATPWNNLPLGEECKWCYKQIKEE